MAQLPPPPRRPRAWLTPLLLALAAGAAALGYAVATRPTPAPEGPADTADTADPAVAFRSIYDTGLWGTNADGKGHSGPGSTLANTVVYRAYLQAFLKGHAIRSVVDAGCGDWEFSQAIDWSGIDYKGYDIVSSVVATNRKRFGAPNLQFFTADIVEADLPAADLLICKHVLQHLPNRAVAKFLGQVPKYKHVLLLNSVDPEALSGDNQDIAVGGYRHLDVTRPPFAVRGRKVLMYWDGRHMNQLIHLTRG